MNRFHAGLLETAVGPSIGAGADLLELIMKARDAGLSSDEQFRLSDLFNKATQNTPFINLFYARPVLDYLFLSSMREAVSPGAQRRIAQRRLKEYGQHSVFPKPLDPFGAF